MRLWVCLLFVVGCYSPSYEDCAISCASNACPSGLECRAGMCRASGATGTCGEHPIDGSVDTLADAAGPTWSSPVAVDLAGMMSDNDPTLTSDMLELYFMHLNQIYKTTRASPTGPWTTPVVVPELMMSGVAEEAPSVTGDGLAMVLSANVDPQYGLDIYISTRGTRNNPWGPPQRVIDSNINTASDESGAWISADQLTLMFGSTRSGEYDIFISKRSGLTNSWLGATPIAELNTTGHNDAQPLLSDDQLTVYFQTNRGLSLDLYTAHRPDATSSFGVPQPITELDDAQTNEGDPWVSPDGHHMFFSSNRSATGNLLYETSR